mgnify:CR=1 FL=1
MAILVSPLSRVRELVGARHPVSQLARYTKPTYDLDGDDRWVSPRSSRVPFSERVFKSPIPALEANVVVMGFALPGANMHAPNEWFALENLALGMKTMTRLYEELARATKRRSAKRSLYSP